MEAKNKAQSDFETKAQRIHTISQLLKAYCLYQRDVQYVVQNNEVVIVDENTRIFVYNHHLIVLNHILNIPLVKTISLQ